MLARRGHRGQPAVVTAAGATHDRQERSDNLAEYMRKTIRRIKTR
jgi:hypothetical protein